MRNFAYTRAEHVRSAIQSITQIPNAKFLGGGGRVPLHCG